MFNVTLNIISNLGEGLINGNPLAYLFVAILYEPAIMAIIFAIIDKFKENKK